MSCDDATVKAIEVVYMAEDRESFIALRKVYRVTKGTHSAKKGDRKCCNKALTLSFFRKEPWRFRT